MSVENILKQLNEARQMANDYNYGQADRRANELKKLVEKEVDKAGKTSYNIHLHTKEQK